MTGPFVAILRTVFRSEDVEAWCRTECAWRHGGHGEVARRAAREHTKRTTHQTVVRAERVTYYDFGGES